HCTIRLGVHCVKGVPQGSVPQNRICADGGTPAHWGCGFTRRTSAPATKGATCESATPFRRHTLGRDRISILGSFSISHSELLHPKIDVLHSQSKAFQQAQAAPIQQLHDQLRCPRQAEDDQPCLLYGQNHRHSRRAIRAHGLDVLQRVVQHLPVKEQQSVKCLV